MFEAIVCVYVVLNVICLFGSWCAPASFQPGRLTRATFGTLVFLLTMASLWSAYELGRGNRVAIVPTEVPVADK